MLFIWTPNNFKAHHFCKNSILLSDCISCNKSPHYNKIFLLIYNLWNLKMLKFPQSNPLIFIWYNFKCVIKLNGRTPPMHFLIYLDHKQTNN